MLKKAIVLVSFVLINVFPVSISAQGLGGNIPEVDPSRSVEQILTFYDGLDVRGRFITYCDGTTVWGGQITPQAETIYTPCSYE